MTSTPTFDSNTNSGQIQSKEMAPGAKAGRICGILAIVLALTCVGIPIAIILGIVAIVKTSKARSLARNYPDSYEIPSSAGLILGIVGLCLPIVMLPVAGIVSAIAIPALLAQRARVEATQETEETRKERKELAELQAAQESKEEDLLLNEEGLLLVKQARGQDVPAVSNMVKSFDSLSWYYKNLTKGGQPPDITQMETHLKTFSHDRNPWATSEPAYRWNITKGGSTKKETEAMAREQASTLGQVIFVFTAPVQSHHGFICGAVKVQNGVNGENTVTMARALE